MDYKGVKIKMRARYYNVSLHKKLIDEIDKLVENQTLGYRSRAELVSDAVRRMLGLKKVEK